jgi:hypothetical protein
MPRSSQWSPTLGPPNQNPVSTSPLPHACHMSMPDRSKVMTQTKRDTLVLQVGGWGMGLTNPSP